ncbi:MAG: hypothetical protein ACRER3_05610, partial [Pseudomonas fluorescens]
MAEATDARLSTSLPGHPKTKKLARRLGAAGPLGCIYLFLWTAANRSDGDLSGMTDEDIELAVDWTGDDGAFVATMMDVGFLEGATCARRVHDWAEHNPWAAGAGDRSQRSKFAAACRDYGRARAEAMYPEYVAKLAADAPKTSAKGPADGENSTGGDAVTSSGSSIKQYKDDLTDESGSCPTPFPSDTDTLPPHFTQE